MEGKRCRCHRHRLPFLWYIPAHCYPCAGPRLTRDDQLQLPKDDAITLPLRAKHAHLRYRFLAPSFSALRPHRQAPRNRPWLHSDSGATR
jgi:hypothetical protein